MFNEQPSINDLWGRILFCASPHVRIQLAKITRTYDGLDQLTQEVTSEETVNYTYDTASRRATMTVVGQPQVTYAYDNADRLTQVQQETSTVMIAYDDVDRRTSLTLPNTNRVAYTSNATSELISLTYKQGARTLGTYTYEAVGNRIKTGDTFARIDLPSLSPAQATTPVISRPTTFGTSTES